MVRLEIQEITPIRQEATSHSQVLTSRTMTERGQETGENTTEQQRWTRVEVVARESEQRSDTRGEDQWTIIVRGPLAHHPVREEQV